MSDAGRPPADDHGLIGIGRALITTLPPAFVMLVLVNVAFLGVVMWFLDNQIEARTKLVTMFVDRCMADIPKIEDLGAMQARFDALEHDVRALETEQRKQH